MSDLTVSELIWIEGMEVLRQEQEGEAMQAIETIYYQDDSDPLGPDWEAIEALEMLGYDESGALDG